MGIHYQSWRPDTCGCILHQRWEDPQSGKQEDIIVEFFAIENVCEEHRPLRKSSLRNNQADKTKKIKEIEDALNLNERRNMDEVRAKIAGKKKANDTEQTIQRQLDRHKGDVLERYDDILSKEFALDKDIYDAALEKNKQKNIAESLKAGKVQQP